MAEQKSIVTIIACAVVGGVLLFLAVPCCVSSGMVRLVFLIGFLLFVSSPLWIPCAGVAWAVARKRFSLRFLFAVMTAEAVSLGAVLWLSEWLATWLYVISF